MEFRVRQASLADLHHLVHHRRAMFEDMGHTDADALAAMATLTADYLRKAIPEGSFRSWLAFDNGHVVAGGALVISPWPSHA